MPSTLLRLAVALLAFGLGVSVTTLWIAYRTPEVKSVKSESVRKKECRTRHAYMMAPLPAIEEPLPPSWDEPLPPPPMPLLPSVPISGGILDGKAISKPQPAYPAIAGAARASGKINVRVLVDESGNVSSAEAISGHPLLQQAAVEAAYRARFVPTRLSGQPVEVSGVLSYTFVLP